MKLRGSIRLCLLLLLGIAVVQQASVLTSPAAAQPPESMQKSIELSRPLQVGIVEYSTREQTASPQIKAQLETLRKGIAEHKARFTVGYTTALDVPLQVLAATVIPRELPMGMVAEVNNRGKQLLEIDRSSAIRSGINLGKLVSMCDPSSSSFDWRKHNKVTPVKAQICGTCWDFTAMGGYEGSYAVRNSALVDTSEQYILNCASAGTCAGGWWMPVFDFMIRNGNTTEAADPFTGNDSLPCPVGVPLPFRASAWAFVGPNISTIPTPQQIKTALCQHGPLATAVNVDPAFSGYTGGVFDESWLPFNWINHGVVIIGWDDSKKAWLIKNSWGNGWGETGGLGTQKGYMWIAYTTNNIGIATAWVDAMSNKYKLPPDWLKYLERFHYPRPIKPLAPMRTTQTPNKAQ